MTDQQNTRPIRNPDHDQHAAGLYRAMALRHYCRYVDIRHMAEFRGSDIAGHSRLPSQLEASEAYIAAVDEWLWETPDTLDAALALIEFAGTISASKLNDEVLRETGPVSDEKDAFHQTMALASAAGFPSERVTSEWIDRRRAAYGPGATSPKEWALRGDAGGAASSGDPLPALGAEMDSLEAIASAAAAAGVPSASDEISKKLVEVEDRAAELKPESLAGSIVVFRVLRRLAQDHDWNETMDRIADNLIAGLEDVASQWPGRIGKTGGTA